MIKMIAKYKFTVIIILIIITGIYLLFADYQQPQKEVNILKEEPADLMENVEFVLYNYGQTRKWEVTVNEIIDNSWQNYFSLKPVTINAYSLEANKELIYFLTAQSGKYYSSENQLNLTGFIELHKGNLLLKVDNVCWQQDRDVITGGNSLKMIAPDYTVSGSGFVSDLSLNEITIQGEEAKQASFSWRGQNN